jgi:pyrroloquinoline quinone (PQQ) biosynthesis protein C
MSQPASIDAPAAQSSEKFIDELCEFILALPPVEGVNPLMYVLGGQLTLDGVREWMKDFWAFGVAAVQRIAGQLAHTAEDARTFRAVAQAFSTEAGCYLTSNHMDLWAEFCAEAGISRAELDQYEPIPETLMCIYTQSWHMIHGTPEESVAVFHLGVPPKIADRVSAGITMGGMGVIRAAGGPSMTASGEAVNLGTLLEDVLEREYGVHAHAGSRFFQLHQEIEPFEQAEGWEYVDRWIRTATQQERFRLAYQRNIVAQRAREQALSRHLLQWRR